MKEIKYEHDFNLKILRVAEVTCETVISSRELDDGVVEFYKYLIFWTEQGKQMDPDNQEKHQFHATKFVCTMQLPFPMRVEGLSTLPFRAVEFDSPASLTQYHLSNTIKSFKEISKKIRSPHLDSID